MKTWIVKFETVNGIQSVNVRANQIDYGFTADSYVADGKTNYVAGRITSITLKQ